MSVFGFDSAVTTQGHFGTGFTNVFEINTDNPPTLEDILECCQAILAAIRKQGFRRERPTRQELMDKMNQIFVENIDIRKELKRLKLNNGEDNGRNNQL
jgi:hypothetical protein